jgi:redox-sensitive bicupin YhaK (pirin superfamily)
MIQIRRANQRGHANHGWLDTHHTFSFSDYYDPEFMGFRSLRVINEDVIKGGYGFPTHPHRDMEIITYVLEGSLEHKDSMGTGSVIRSGEVQKMSAGTGIRHSEFNHSKTDPVHLYQIWILPEREGIKPMYEQKMIGGEEKQGRLRLVASPRGGNGNGAPAGSLQLCQDVELYLTQLDPGQSVEHPLAAGRYAWVQAARGSLTVNGQELKQGDGAALASEPSVQIAGLSHGSEALLFDLG